MRIGFFDSGVGGINVLKEALNILPDEDFLYYADTDNVPYGTKSKEKVVSYIIEAVGFMAEQGIKALVVACNTATSVAIKDLRKKYDFPILGMEPAVKPAVAKSHDKRVLVVATPMTLREQKFHSLIAETDSSHIVDALSLPELVEYAEKFVFEEDIIVGYLKEKLSGYNIDEYGVVVLGCTHFPFYRSSFRRIFTENTDIIDGSAGTVKHLKKVLENNGLYTGNGSGNIIYYSSKKLEPAGSRYEKYLKLSDWK